MPSIAYRYKDALYLNITNRCPCDCQFCLRNDKPAVGYADSLWLDHEPSAAEVKEAVSVYNVAHFSEVVYCGYGEPFSAYPVLLDTARWLKTLPDCPPVRVNTNGLGDLIVGRPTLPDLVGSIDALSISLNAPTPQAYVALCRPQYGLDALPAVIAFARAARQLLPQVVLTVVDVLPPSELAACKRLAADLKIPLRVRSYA